MKRTSPWIYVAGAAVQLAALGLCIWAMERWLGSDAAAEGAPAEAGPAPGPPAPPPLGGASLFDVAADVAPAPQSSPPPPPPAAPPPPVPQAAYVPQSPSAPQPPPAPVEPVRPEPRPAPLFGPPPARAERPTAAVPPFVFEGGDEGTQVLRGLVGEGSLVIGIAADGNIRCVDVDGARYSGQSESARARLREVDGSRAFTVQLGIDGAGALHASFTGGGHDGETIALSPLVEGSAS